MGRVSPTRCVAMDEQRVQAYLSLIQDLLACASGMDLSARLEYLSLGVKPKYNLYCYLEK
ncbi:MAG: hypothetical protein HLUCCO16_15140 [Phormidium sp. OSCR]|nr:MAG: hypothetical protein HLUCCO16_15140 [Phormidium sp. OSCR]